MTDNRQHVYLVDDDEAVRASLKLLLETLGLHVSVFAEPMGFLARLSSLSPGCVIVDIRMPALSGLKLQERLISAGCDWPVIVISGHGDIEACRRAFRNGAVDYLAKPVDEQRFIDAIQKGHLQLSKHHAEVAEIAEAVGLLARLSPREREVLELVTKGFMTKEIAKNLSLSPRTVESHRASIAAKLETGAPAEMTRILLSGTRRP